MLQNILAVSFPIMTIFGTNLFVKSTSSDGANVLWRPNPVVFMIVWTLITIVVITSWNMCINKLIKYDQKTLNYINFLFLGFLSCAALWQVLYHQKTPDAKKNGIVALIFLLFFLLPLIMYCYFLRLIYPAMLLVIPLIWIIVALRLNIAEIENTK